MLHYNNLNQAQAAGTGKSLPAGGYVAQIMGAIETETRKHEPMIEIRLEIAEGEYKGIFNSKVRTPGTWPNAGVYRLSLPADQNAPADDFRLRNLKGLITSLEESNAGFTFRDDVRDLRGRFVGILYRDEEFIGQDGAKHVSARPAFFCSVQTIRSGDFTVPRPKLLEENAMQQPQTYTSVPQDAGFIPVEATISGDKDLPF